MFSARKAKFYVDSVHVADLNAKGYTWLHVPQGTHTLTQRWPIDTLTQTIGGPIRFVAGRTYFFRLTSGSNYAEMYWQLAEQPWNTAAAEIEECRYQKAKTGKRG